MSDCEKITARSTAMAKMYESGKTLEYIGKKYSITHQRVSQIIRPHGLDSKYCGRAATVKSRKADKTKMHMEKWGCDKAQRSLLMEMHGRPTYKYLQQRKNAKNRGICWEFTLWGWWQVWEESGKWSERGCSRLGYVMARFNDVGPYEKDNVEIITHSQNSIDCRTRISQGRKNKLFSPS